LEGLEVIKEQDVNRSMMSEDNDCRTWSESALK